MVAVLLAILGALLVTTLLVTVLNDLRCFVIRPFAIVKAVSVDLHKAAAVRALLLFGHLLAPVTLSNTRRIAQLSAG